MEHRHLEAANFKWVSIQGFTKFSLRLKVEELHWICGNDALGEVKMHKYFITVKIKTNTF